MFNNVHKELYVIILSLAFVFSFMSTLNQRYLLSIVIIVMVSYISYLYLVDVSNKKEKDGSTMIDTVIKDIEGRSETNNHIFYVDKFSKKMKYLAYNNELMRVLTNIRFIRKFNRSVYGDIVLNMDKMMKIYVYMLSDRYDINAYMPMFIDVKNAVLDILQSLVMIVPQRMKHTYGVDTYEEIDRTTNDFIEVSKKMIGIISKYARMHPYKEYIMDTMYEPHNSRP